MKIFLVNGEILTPDEKISGHALIVQDSRIYAIESSGLAEQGCTVIDAKGGFIIPGLIDIHVHGSNGSDTMDATPHSIQQMGEFFCQFGVTSFLPTTVTASAQDINRAIDNIRTTPPTQSGARHLGIHLEGPYLSADYRGAQPVHHLRAPDPAEYNTWLASQQVRLITVAPEVEGVLGFITAARAADIEFAVGHSHATYEQVLAAVACGLRQVTHTFNGMPPLHHRTPGVLGAALTNDRLYAQVIVDGVHVHPTVVKLLIAAKGIERTILITDAIRATGMPDGDYALGDQQVNVTAGVARTAEGSLAGSTLTMDRALRNVMEFAGLNLPAALPMATRIPAASLGLDDKKGSLAPGMDADLAILDADYRVRLTMVAGQVVYQDL